MQRAGDFYLLLFGNGQFHHQIGGAEMGAEAVNHRLGLRGHLFPLHQPATRQFAAEKDVFRHREVWRELHLLINQGNTCGQRVFRPFDVVRLAVNQYLAAGGGIRPGEDFHQGAFACAVFAH
ncbi:hypothetical protein D3C81_1975560 [compost metagenome]